MDRRRILRLLVVTLVVAALAFGLAVAVARSMVDKDVGWRAALDVSEPRIRDAQGAVLVAHDDGLLVLGELTGQVRFNLDSPRPIVATPYGRDFFVSGDEWVEMLDRNGEWRWRVDLEESDFPAALDLDKKRFVVGNGPLDRMRALDLADGQEAWARDVHFVSSWSPAMVQIRTLPDTHQTLAVLEKFGEHFIVDSVTGEMQQPTDAHAVSVLDTFVDVGEDCQVRLEREDGTHRAIWADPQPERGCSGAAGDGSVHWVRSEGQLHALDLGRDHIRTLEGFPAEAVNETNYAGDVLAVPVKDASDAGGEPVVQIWDSKQGTMRKELNMEPVKIVHGSRTVLLVDKASPVLSRLAGLDPDISYRYQLLNSRGKRIASAILEGRYPQAVLNDDSAAVVLVNDEVVRLSS